MLGKMDERAWPELARFEAGAGRQAADKLIAGIAMRSPRAWLLALLIAGAVWLPFLLLARVLTSKGAMWEPIISLVIPGILIPTVISMARPVLLSREDVRRKLRALLRTQGVALCIPCGYELRGQTGDNCPECGQPHRLMGAGEQGSRRMGETER